MLLHKNREMDFPPKNTHFKLITNHTNTVKIEVCRYVWHYYDGVRSKTSCLPLKMSLLIQVMYRRQIIIAEKPIINSSQIKNLRFRKSVVNLNGWFKVAQRRIRAFPRFLLHCSPEALSLLFKFRSTTGIHFRFFYGKPFSSRVA